MSQPPPPHEPVSGRASAWLPLSATFLVFLGFVGYGFLAPTTYRASALIVFKPIANRHLVLPNVPPPSERLRAAAVDPETLLQVANALELGSGPSGQAAAKAVVDARLDVRSPRANTFEFSFTYPTAPGAERATNLLARHAATRATAALSPTAPDENAEREAARSKSANELAAFMAQHPELGPSPSVTPVGPSPKDTPDADGSALRAERDQIRVKLARLPEASGDSDNPFGEGAAAAAEIKRMRRRMAEIEQSLAARKRVEKGAEPARKVDPQVDREWKRLLAAVASPTITASATPEPTFTVMLSEATRPTAPIAPDRRLVAIIGVIASLLAGGALGILQLLRRRPAGELVPEPTYRYPSDRPLSQPPRPRSDPPREGSDRPWPRSEPPREGSDRPWPRSEPPREGSEPPRPISEPPRASSAPPRSRSDEPPRPSSEPLRPVSEPPGTGALSTRPILAIADTGVAPTRARPTSSNPPPRPEHSSEPPRLQTTAPAVVPSPPPRTIAGLAPPSPLPPAPSPPPPRPTPGYEVLGKLDPSAPVPKGTLVGLMPFDPRALDRTLVSQSPEPTQAEREGPFAQAPSVREPDGPRSTLRPPPPDGPDSDGAFVAEVMKPDPPAGATHVAPQPGEQDNAWTGPSRAHRRSVPAGRRTTQMLGSPIAPVTRGSSRPPVARRDSNDTPEQAGTYSYVSTRPPEAPTRPPLDTPPYYQPNTSGRRAHPPSTPHPQAPRPRPPAPRPRVLKHPLRPGWAPEGAVDSRKRRDLADELFPLAVDQCFVLGITAVGGAKHHKSRVAAELALALAEPRHPRVLLLEADFQGAAVHRVMRIDMPLGAGFSQQLRGMASTPDSWTVVEVNPSLHVLAEGIMRSPGLILSVQFEESIRSLRAYYDLIVLDGPDTSAEVECQALSSVVDGIVMVASAAGSPDLGRAAQLFPDKRYSTVVGV